MAVIYPRPTVTAPWVFNWFLDGNENKVDISIVGTNGIFFLINAHGVLRRMCAVTEIPGTHIRYQCAKFGDAVRRLTCKRLIPIFRYFCRQKCVPA